MNKRTAVVLYLLVSLVLIGLAILRLRNPIDHHSWSGDLAFTTTTPSLALLPELPTSVHSPIP